jgi:hypothetical protein
VRMEHTFPNEGSNSGWLGLTSSGMGADLAQLLDRPARATTSRGTGGPWALYLFTAVGKGQAFRTPHGETGFADLTELGQAVTERPMVHPAGDTLAFALRRPGGVSGPLTCVVRVNMQVVADIADLHALGLPRGTDLCAYACMAYEDQQVTLSNEPFEADRRESGDGEGTAPFDGGQLGPVASAEDFVGRWNSRTNFLIAPHIAPTAAMRRFAFPPTEVIIDAMLGLDSTVAIPARQRRQSEYAEKDHNYLEAFRAMPQWLRVGSMLPDPSGLLR